MGSFSKWEVKREEKREKGRKRWKKEEKDEKRSKKKRKGMNKKRCGWHKKGEMGSKKKLFCRKNFGKLFKLSMGRLSRYMEQYTPLDSTLPAALVTTMEEVFASH